jgi:PAS domain S-box-containing protein
MHNEDNMVGIESHVIPAAGPLAIGPTPHEEFDQVIRKLVGSLRERCPGGLGAVFAPLLVERNKALAGELSSDGARILESYDRLIMTALSKRYDSLDTALSRTSFAVAEIDGLGIISYANDALEKLLPDAIGRDFATLFGARSGDVRAALTNNRRETLRLDLHRGNLPSVHMRGEIGPLIDEFARSGAYALLLGVEGEEARFDTLPDGILRLDPEGKIVFANRRAEEIVKANRAELRGQQAASLFATSDLGDNSSRTIANWLKSPDGHRDRAELVPLDGSASIPVRITVAPSFDTAESRAGAIVTIVPIAEELVQTRLQQLLSIPNCEPEQLVRGVIEAVQGIAPYDLATFGVYTEDMRYHKTLVVHPRPDWTWTTAWFSLDTGVSDFLLSDKTWGSDLHATSIALTPSLEDDQVLKHIIESEMKGFVTLPITGGGQRVRASLTLLSKQADCYDGREVKQMRDLGVEKALLVAEANILRRRDDRVRTLQKQLASASGYIELARALSVGIAECFGWDYVAVFAVDRRENLFRLIHQCNRTGSPDVDPKYNQALTEGLLGAALRDNAALAEPNIEAGSQFGYKPVIPERRSALAVPVRVLRQARKSTADEVEWMLSIESAQRNAFQGPDMVSLNDLLAQCEDILRRRWLNAVQVSLLDAVEQAVVIVDRAGKMRLTNRWANTLFGRQGGMLLGDSLKSFGAEDADRRLLGSTEPFAQVRLKLCVDQAVYIPTLATQRPLNDDYGHCLWLFTDLREQEQQSNLSYLEQTVNEVAQNTRLPLMLAGSLLRKAINSHLDVPAIAEMLNGALRQLDKADITYERLACTLAVRQEPDRPGRLFDAVDVLRQAITDLPQEDFDYCDLSGFPTGSDLRPFPVFGWPEQLSFAFRSLLGYLLFQRPTESKVHVGLAYTAEGGLHINLSVSNWATSELIASPTWADRIGAAEQQAREAVSLASEAVQAAVNRHNGKLLEDLQNSMLTFRVELRPM